MTEDPCAHCQKDMRLLDQKIAALERFTAEQFRGRDAAVQSALAAMDMRLANMSEFRGAISDTSAKMVGREEYRAGHEALITRMNRNEERLALLEGRGMTFNVLIPAATLFLHMRT